jgi:peptidase A4-like protein
LITSFAVNPGDAIFASVYYSSSTKEYTYNVTDESSGQGLKLTQACPAGAGCSNDSAQVATSGGPYATFTEVQFAAIKVTDSAGNLGGLKDADWQTLYGYSGEPDENPPGAGPLYSSTLPAQSTFQVAW